MYFTIINGRPYVLNPNTKKIWACNISADKTDVLEKEGHSIKEYDNIYLDDEIRAVYNIKFIERVNADGKLEKISNKVVGSQPIEQKRESHYYKDKAKEKEGD